MGVARNVDRIVDRIGATGSIADRIQSLDRLAVFGKALEVGIDNSASDNLEQHGANLGCVVRRLVNRIQEPRILAEICVAADLDENAPYRVGDRAIVVARLGASSFVTGRNNHAGRGVDLLAAVLILDNNAGKHLFEKGTERTSGS